MDSKRSHKLRTFYSELVIQRAGIRSERVRHAFSAVRREIFVGKAPWSIVVGGYREDQNSPKYIETPDDDPAFLYQDNLIGLNVTKGINTGQPSLHARCIDALDIQPGAHVIHVGAGTGYFTAILAELVGPNGKIWAYEIDMEMASRAKENLCNISNVIVLEKSGISSELPKVDAIYVNAGLPEPSLDWLDALLPGGRLIFPLQPIPGWGGMLFIQKPLLESSCWAAAFLARASFIACKVAFVADASVRLRAAFKMGNWGKVRSIRFGERIDSSCWFKGDGWWLSMSSDKAEETQTVDV